MPRIAWICHPSLDGVDGVAEQARAAEEAALDALVISDEVLDGGRPLADPWEPALRVAAVTSELTLIPITAHPIVEEDLAAVARRAAEVARAAPGRLELGLTVGDPNRDGHPLLNWERMSRMARVLPAFRALLAGEAVSTRGPHLTVEEAALDDPPRHHVPVWMLADGPSSARMAARLADGVLVELTQNAGGEVLKPYRDVAPGGPVAAIVGAPTIEGAFAAVRGMEVALLAVRTPGDPAAEISSLGT